MRLPHDPVKAHASFDDPDLVSRAGLAAPVIAGTRLRGGNASSARGAASMVTEAAATARVAGLWVPITSSTSCDQAIFVDRAADGSVSSDAVLVEIDRLG